MSDTVHLSDNVTLGAAYDGGGSCPGSHDVLQWDVYLQHHQCSRPFDPKAEAQHVQSAAVPV